MSTVKIYTTPACPWCAKTKRWMKGHKIRFTNIDVSEDMKAQREMIEKSGQMGVPVLDIGGKIIVGYDPAGIRPALKAMVAREKSKRTKAASAKKPTSQKATPRKRP